MIHRQSAYEFIRWQKWASPKILPKIFLASTKVRSSILNLTKLMEKIWRRYRAEISFDVKLFCKSQIIKYIIKWGKWPRLCAFALVSHSALVRSVCPLFHTKHININFNAEPRIFAVSFNALFMWDRFLFIDIDLKKYHTLFGGWQTKRFVVKHSPLTLSVLQPIRIHMPSFQICRFILVKT